MNQIPSNGAEPPTQVGLSDQVRPQLDADNPFAKPTPKPAAPSTFAAPMASAEHYPMSGRYRAPHRGGLILTLGIVSLFCNFFMVPGILAWTLGSSDLKKMNAGQMDSTGYGTTQAGMIIGIISTCLVILGIIIYLGFFILAIAMAAAGAA